MSESNKFVSLGMPVGPARLTFSGANVEEVLAEVNSLIDVDETDPDGLSPVSALIDGVSVIAAAADVKFSMQKPSGMNIPAPQVSSGSEKTCAHGNMTYKEGISRTTQKPYKAYFCNAAYGQQKCDPVFIR